MIDQELLTTCIDSEIPKVVKPVIRTRRRRNLKDPQLLAEYQAYCEGESIENIFYCKHLLMFNV